MKARTNTGKRGAEKCGSVFALSFLFYRINTADSLSALVLLRDGSLIYGQPGLPAVFLDQSQKISQVQRCNHPRHPPTLESVPQGENGEKSLKRTGIHMKQKTITQSTTAGPERSQP